MKHHKISGIYLLSDPRTLEPKYVGKSKNLAKRIKNYVHAQKNLIAHSRRLSSWFRDLRRNELQILFTILEVCPEEDLYKRELHWYHHYSKDYVLLNYPVTGEDLKLLEKIKQLRKREGW